MEVNKRKLRQPQSATPAQQSSEIMGFTSWHVIVINLGIQEYVEAVSFLHYIRHRSLISLEEINARLVFMQTEQVEPTVKD